MTSTHNEPVSKLIKLGRPSDPWQDYLAMGITHDHIPELLRLVQDEELRMAKPPDDFPKGEDFTKSTMTMTGSLRMLPRFSA